MRYTASVSCVGTFLRLCRVDTKDEVARLQEMVRKEYATDPVGWERRVRIRVNMENPERYQRAEELFKFLNTTYGLLTPLYRTDETTSNGIYYWAFRCSCDGKVIKKLKGNVVSGSVKSCGCVREENNKIQGKVLAAHQAKTSLVEGTALHALNRRIGSNNTSGHKGVRWNKTRRKWMAYINFKGKRYNLIFTEDKKLAINMRRRAERELFDPILSKYGRAPTRQEVVSFRDSILTEGRETIITYDVRR